MDKKLKKLVALLQEALALLGVAPAETPEEDTEAAPETAEATPAPAFVSAEEVDALSKDDVKALAEHLGFDVAEHKVSALRAFVKTAMTLADEDTAEEAEEADVVALADALGISYSKPSKAVAAVQKYLASVKDAEPTEEAEEEAAPVEEEESEAAEETEAEEDEEETPKKGKGKKKASDDDEEDAAPAEEEEGEEEEADDDSDGPDAAEQAKRLKAYNAKAKKPLKTYAQLAERMTDDATGEAAEWGAPYTKGDVAYCCGLPLVDVKIKGKDCGKCVITGKVFTQNDDGELVLFRS